MTACADCALPYGDPGWCDVVVPDEVWSIISPTGHSGGVLCMTCMARRLIAAGLSDVPMMVTSGPWEPDPRARTWRSHPSWSDYWAPAEPKGAVP